jgi:hypothetical protein
LKGRYGREILSPISYRWRKGVFISLYSICENKRRGIMKTVVILVVLSFILGTTFPALAEKELPKIGILDLEGINVPPGHARALTSILVSETARLGKYEVYN